jgi:hypothetical protein
MLASTVPARAASEDNVELIDGAGWTMTRLDMTVRIESDEPSLEIGGTMTLRSDRDFSPGPALWMNSVTSGMRWTSLDGAQIASSNLNVRSEEDAKVLIARARLRHEVSPGDEITLRFSAEKVADSGQLLSREDIALASWIEAWYPVCIVDSIDSDSIPLD